MLAILPQEMANPTESFSILVDACINDDRPDLITVCNSLIERFKDDAANALPTCKSRRGPMIK